MDTAIPSAPSIPAHINNAPGFNAVIALEVDWAYASSIPKTEEGKLVTKQQLVQANTTLPTHKDWEQKWLTTNNGTPITAIYISKRQHAEEIHARPEAQVKQLHISRRPFPELGWNIVSNPMTEPIAPDEATKRKAAEVKKDWIEVKATARLSDFLQKARRDEQGRRGHRMRLQLGAASSELRISPHEYDAKARELIGQGWTLIKRHGAIQVLDQTDTSDITWGFDAETLRERAGEISWPDRDLQSALKFGFDDHSNSTPPMSVASPHQTKALSNKKEFDVLIDKEIDKGWYTDPTQFPHTLPFRLTPGSLEPKSTPGKFRLIRNSSWPRQGTFNSCITNGMRTQPLATNDCTVLPTFMGFEWTNIDSNNVTILILADLAKRIGTNLTGTTIDFTDWFRQFAISKKDFWKSAIATKDGVRIDRRLQMGRRSSALHGQRLSFLIAELIEREAEAMGWGLEGLSTEQMTDVKKWQTERKHLDPRQTRIFKVGPFQDDHAFFTITPGQHILHKCRQLLQEKLRIELSPKPEANQPLSTHFKAIGACYDTTGDTGVTFRPKNSIVQKFIATVQEAESSLGTLIPLRTAQRWMGLAQFIQQFINDGRFYLNTGYLAIKASEHIRTRTPRVFVGEQWTSDLASLKDKLCEQLGEAIPTAQPVWDRGINGPFVDATATTSTDGRGWGVVMGNTFARGSWPESITELCRRKVLSINHLELLAVAIAIDIFGRDGLLPPDNRRIVVRGDNIGARDIINKWTAEGPIMECILRLLHNACRERRIRVWMIHVFTKDNVVADGLSRSQDFHTSSPILRNGRQICPPKRLDAWLTTIIKAAKAQTARGQHHLTDTHSTITTDDENARIQIDCDEQLALK